jgi:hypothetical protein
MEFCRYDFYFLILFILIVYLFYLFYNQIKFKEGFQSSSQSVDDTIRRSINAIYRADIDAMRNLSSIASQLTTSNYLKLPGKLVVNDRINFGNDTDNRYINGNAYHLKPYIIHSGGDNNLHITYTDASGNPAFSNGFTMDQSGNSSFANGLTAGNLRLTGDLVVDNSISLKGSTINFPNFAIHDGGRGYQVAPRQNNSTRDPDWVKGFWMDTNGNVAITGTVTASTISGNVTKTNNIFCTNEITCKSIKIGNWKIAQGDNGNLFFVKNDNISWDGKTNILETTMINQPVISMSTMGDIYINANSGARGWISEMPNRNKSIGAIMIDTGTNGNIYSIAYTTNYSDLGMSNKDDRYVLMPHFDLTVYDGANGTGAFTRYENNTDTIKYFNVSSSRVNKGNHCRLYFWNVEVFAYP